VRQPLTVVVLAAGLGTRMKSNRAKVLHQVGGRPLIAHVLRNIAAVDPDRIIVVTGHQRSEVEAAATEAISDIFPKEGLSFAEQKEQKGTGHAVMAALDLLKSANGITVVVYGDVPRARSSTLKRLIDEHSSNQNAATMITAVPNDPTGYGRVIRSDSGDFNRIVEQKDCTADELEIQEINTGFYCFDTAALVKAVSSLTNDNAQGEYYLTDVPALILQDGGRVGIMRYADAEELLGINTRAELASTSKKMRVETLNRLMKSGVTPWSRTRISASGSRFLYPKAASSLMNFRFTPWSLICTSLSTVLS